VVARFSIRLPDNTFLEITADPLTLRITDEYIEVTPLLDNVPVASVEVTDDTPLEIEMLPKREGSGQILDLELPYVIDIYDDATHALMQSGIVEPTSKYRVPDRYKRTT